MLRILHLTGSFDTTVGGPAEAVSGLAAALAAAGNEVRVLTVGETAMSAPALARLRHPNIRVECCRTHPWAARYLASIAMPRRLLALADGCDLIIAHGYYTLTLLAAVRLKRWHGRPVVVMPHGSLEPYQEQRHSFRKSLFRLLVGEHGIDAFAVATDAEALALRTHKWLRAPISVVGLAANTEEIHRERRVRDSESIEMLALGRIATKKRLDLCIDAVAALTQSGLDVHLTIAGSGDAVLQRELEGHASALSVADRVFFVGEVQGEAKLRLLEESTLLLLPSDNENFAVVVAEAMAAGLPVVVSEFVALSQVVAKFDCGVVLADRSVETISEAILRVVGDTNHFSNNTIAAADSISWTHSAQAWHRLAEGLGVN